MQAAILSGERQIGLDHVPDPRPRADEVLIEVAAAGICGTDLHVYRGEFRERVRYPAILGHEFGGVVTEVGREASGVRRGERVAVDPILPCHACAACRTGRFNACQSLRLLGIDLPGGFAQYVAAPASQVHRLPDSVSLEHAPMVEMYGLGLHVLGRGRVQPAEKVVILGAGKLGLSVLDVLLHGARPALAVVTDLKPDRLAMAQKLGADHALDLRREDPVARVLELTDGVGADCVIEAVGHYHASGEQESPLGQAVKMIRNAGRIVTAGLGEQLSAVHFKTLVLKEAEIIASRVTQGEFPRAIAMLGSGGLHPDLLITQHSPLCEAAAAFQRVDRDERDTLKIVLDVRTGG